MIGKVSLYILAVLCTISTGCFIGAGTHGSIKGYRYEATKDQLEKAVMTVIKSNPNILRDSISNYIVNVTNGNKDTIIDNSYNDGKKYVTIKIKTDEGENEYTFRYYGDEQEWRVSSSSELFICYAYDQNGNGGSEGGGGLEWYRWGLKKKFTDLFEREFISQVDKQLNLPHTDSK